MTTREVVEVEEAVGVTVVEAKVVDAEEVCFFAPNALPPVPPRYVSAF